MMVQRLTKLNRSRSSRGNGRGKRLGLRRFEKDGKPATRRWTSCATGTCGCPAASIHGKADLIHSHRLTSSLAFYRSLMGIRSVKAVADHELHLEYDIRAKASQTADKGAVTLVLQFDPTMRRLANAHVRVFHPPST